MNNDQTAYLKPELFQPQLFYKNRLVLMAILFINLPLILSGLYLIIHPNYLLNGELIAVFLLGSITGTLLLLREIHQLDQLIILATKVINLYFQKGECLQISNSYSGTIGKLFQAIDYGIHSCENKLMDLKIESSSPQSEEIFQFFFQKETAEDRLRQCFSIATRYELPLCIALIRIEGLEFNNIQELSYSEPEVIELAQQLSEILRDSDWAAPWGDNEFILTIFSEVEGTKIALERIFQRLSNPKHSTSNCPQPPTSIAIGFTKVQPNEHYLACVDRANQAIEKAKEIGQPCIYL